MPNTNISITQALMLGISSITVAGHLLFIPVIIEQAGRDAWLSLIAAGGPFLFLGLVLASLSRQFQGKSLIQYSQDILGKWGGRLLSTLFLFYIAHDATLSIRGFGEFYTSAITPDTPIIVFFIGLIILGVYAVKSGLEVIARTNQLFLTILIPIGILTSILTHNNKDYKNFLPILADGYQPVMLGAMSLLSVFSTFIVMSMIFPHLNSFKHLTRWTMVSICILILMFIGPVTGPIALFGEEGSKGITFTSYQILRDVQVGEIKRLDMIAVMLWGLGSFAKVSVFLYAIVIGIAQLFHIEDYRPLAIPVGSLLVILSLLNSENLLGIHEFLLYVYPYYSTAFGMLLPLLLWSAAWMRNKFRRREVQT